MHIYTSYYGKLRDIPKDFFIVSASRSLSEELKIAVDCWDIDLSPSNDIMFSHKDNPDWGTYVKRFKSEILPTIDWLEKLEKFEEIANKIGKTVDNIVILCYESVVKDGKGQYCHRFILAESIEEEFSTTVKEYGFEDYNRNNYRLEPPISTAFLF